MSRDTSILMYLREGNWIRAELRKASRVTPAREMNRRVRELLARSEALAREVTEFLDTKDTHD